MGLNDLPTVVEAPLEAHELEHLARKHGVTVEHVKEVIKQIHAICRIEIEATLERRFPTLGRRETAPSSATANDP